MQVVTILGNPRKSGNTAAVLEHFEESVLSPHRVQRIDLAGCAIGGCRGCDACQKRTDKPGCVQKDDAAGIFDQLLAGKRAALLITCGGTAEHYADLIGPTFERAMSCGQS
jgi:multimeric flavodoxin WrbA